MLNKNQFHSIGFEILKLNESPKPAHDILDAFQLDSKVSVDSVQNALGNNIIFVIHEAESNLGLVEVLRSEE